MVGGVEGWIDVGWGGEEAGEQKRPSVLVLQIQRGGGGGGR